MLASTGAPPGVPANAWTRPPTSTWSIAHESASIARGGHERRGGEGSERRGDVVSGFEHRVGAELGREASSGFGPLHDRHPRTRRLQRPHPDDPEGARAHHDGEVALGHVEHPDGVQATRERLDRGRELEREPVERDDVTVGHHDQLRQAAVALDPDVDVVGASVLEAERARRAPAAAHVRLHADRGPVLEHAGHLVTRDPRFRRPRVRQPPVGRADRGRADPNGHLAGRRLGLGHVERGDPARTIDPNGPHPRSLPRDRPSRRLDGSGTLTRRRRMRAVERREGAAG